MTMHSWNFINKYFFLNKYVSLNKRKAKKFEKMIRYALNNGYIFCDISKEGNNILDNSSDQVFDLCEKSLKSKLYMFFNNFIRFWEIGKLNKKYFTVYISFFLVLFIVVVALLVLLLRELIIWR